MCFELPIGNFSIAPLFPIVKPKRRIFEIFGGVLFFLKGKIKRRMRAFPSGEGGSRVRIY